MGLASAGDIDQTQTTDDTKPDDTTNPEPKYKANILATVDGETRPTLCDTGCQRSCISENFLRRHPNLYKHKVGPHKGRTVSIDGSKVETLGVINIKFRISGRYLRMNCRIIKNLVYDFVLGWDFFTRYKCSIHPSEGYLQYENEKIDLVKDSVSVSSSHFSLAEDAVVPPLSKMLTQATFYINPADNISTTNTVEVHPIRENSARIAVGRNISRVDNGKFIVELLNPFDTHLTVKASAVLGHVSFTTDEELAGCTEDTDITLAFGGENSGYESEATDKGKKPKKTASTKPTSTAKPSTVKPPNITKSPKPKKPPDPPASGDKPVDSSYKLDYSTISEDAKPKLAELKHLLEVKHGDVFSTGDRDWGMTDIVEHRANIKPGPPIVIRPYRATPEMQQEMDRQVHEMLADGLVSHSTSSYSAPVLLVKKKLGGWRFCTDFRKVNARCERVVYPLPRIDDALHKLKSPKFFSTMDLMKGFNKWLQ